MHVILGAILIFLAMVFMASISTSRLIALKLKKKVWGAVSFLQIALFVLVITMIMRDPANTFMVLSYVIASGSGIIAGLVISDKLSARIYSTYIITKESRAMEQLFKEVGFKVNCYNGLKREKGFNILKLVSAKKKLSRISRIAKNIDQNAYVVNHNLSHPQKGIGDLEMIKKNLSVNNQG